MYRDRALSNGMRSNGGCSCFDMLPTKKRRFVERTYQQLDAALAEVERLRKSVIDHLVFNGPCELSDDESSGLCSDDNCTYCNLERVLHIEVKP
jgi:hypothetical protein